MIKTYKPQKLTVALVKRKAREAYKARKLTAQHRDPDKRLCVYSIGTYHCPIGAALSKEALAQVKLKGDNSGAGVDILSKDGIITPLSAREWNQLDEIQSVHDSWAVKARCGLDVAYQRKIFRKLIGMN